MTTSRFRLSVERAPGALERVLAVARRRRLGLESVSVTAADTERWDVAIVAGVPLGEGSLTLRNFAALVNVRAASIQTGEEGLCPTEPQGSPSSDETRSGRRSGFEKEEKR